MEEDLESDQMFEEVRKYLSDGTYYEDSDKAHKAIVRRRSKKFELQDGTLMYKDSKDGKDGNNFLRLINQ